MHFRPGVAAACTSICLWTANAAPTSPWGHEKIHRITSDVHLDGVAALRKSFTKYGWSLSPGFIDRFDNSIKPIVNEKIAVQGLKAPSPLSSQSKGKATGEVQTFAANDGAEYLCPVNVGGQTLHMNLDTGSSDLWLFSTALESHERGSHSLYDPAKSRSHKAVPQAAFKVAYGDDTSMQGHVAADSVAIGGVSVTNQALAMPTSFSAGIIDDPSDGIVGLGFQNMNSICTKGAAGENGAGSSHTCPDGYTPNPRPTWFDNAKTTLKQGVFSVNFKPGTPGYFNFGSIDHTAYKGAEPHYIPVDGSKGYWQFTSKSYKVGSGKNVAYAGADGIADSGTSLLMLQPEVVAAYYKGVKGVTQDESGYTYPCGTKLPDFEIEMGDYMALIPGSVINYANVPDSAGRCYGGIQSNDGQAPQIFGDIMFKALFVVFDHDNMRLGLAPHA